VSGPTPAPDESGRQLHAMQYRAGSRGLGRLGVADSEPHWLCACGQWRYAARPNGRARSGNNLAAAQRAWAAHAARALGDERRAATVPRDRDGGQDERRD